MSQEKRNAKEEENKPKPRDIWDKISIFSSFFSLVVLGGLTFWFNQKTAEIQSQIEILKTNIQTAELVQQLINDLQSKQSRRDIALIALNRTIADKDEQSKLMVSEIATQTYKETLKELMSTFKESPKNTQESIDKIRSFQDTFIAYKIVRERNPNQADELIADLRKLQNQTQNNDEKEFLNSLIKSFSSGITIYYNDLSQGKSIDRLKQDLENQKLQVASVEFIKPEKVLENYPLSEDKKPVSAIKYFYNSDEDKVKKLQTIANDYFNQNFKNMNIKFKIEPLLEQPDVPYGEMEIWIYFDQSQNKN